jgi:predicted ATP-grasp superfamily ATP-dependent carboligase
MYEKPLACVIGDLSLVRALGRAGIPVVLVAGSRTPVAAHSRYTREVLEVPSFVDAPDAAVAALFEFGRQHARPSVLFPQGDHDLLAVSRARDLLSAHFRFALPERELVEDLVDKRRFAALAERRGLPTPRTTTLRQGELEPAALERWRTFPAILKPSMRTHWFDSRLHALTPHGPQKALRVESRHELASMLPSMRAYEGDFILQELVPGGEDHILSYHAYASDGRVIAEFTGRKVRTLPRSFGLSSCVEITDDAALRQLGRSFVAQVSFSGVVKLDFKRHADNGRLYLLEANPRFNLWHHPAALAGVNLPALVYRHVTEDTLPDRRLEARAGVRWMSARDDFAAMREYRAAGELTFGRWLLDLFGADIREDLALGDPGPTLRSALATLSRRGGRLAGRLRASFASKA